MEQIANVPTHRVSHKICPSVSPTKLCPTLSVNTTRSYTQLFSSTMLYADYALLQKYQRKNTGAKAAHERMRKLIPSGV